MEITFPGGLHALPGSLGRFCRAAGRRKGLSQAAALPSGHVSLSAVLSAALVSAWVLLCFVLICPLHYVLELEAWISL